MNFIVKLISWSLKLLRYMYKFSDAVLSGFWLGVISEKTLDLYNKQYYDGDTKYLEDKYNLSGLHKWEYDMIKKHFHSARSMLMIGAGGGRETAALRKWGVEIDSYECSEKFVAYGNDLFRKSNIDARIIWLAANSVPDVIKEYDGIILGWGVYTHINGSKNRISLLKKLHPFCKKDTPLMISFKTKEGSGRLYKIVLRISNFFRFILRRPATESGDSLQSYFSHHFNKAEIESEFRQSGFRIVDYYDEMFGCAIGIRGNQP